MNAGHIDVHAHFLPAFYRDALAERGLSHPDGMPTIPAWSEGDALGIMGKLGIRAATLSISSPGVHLATTRPRVPSPGA